MKQELIHFNDGALASWWVTSYSFCKDALIMAQWVRVATLCENLEGRRASKSPSRGKAARYSRSLKVSSAISNDMSGSRRGERGGYLDPTGTHCWH